MTQFLGLLGSALLVLGAGASFVMQQAVNADLRASLHSAAWAGVASYLGGTLCMLLLAIFMREAIPSSDSIARSEWWAWSGGLFGAIFIFISILFVPRLGTTTFVALLVAGQMLSSLAFDHYGLFGIPQHSVDPLRFLGAALLVAGVVLIHW
ncbi:MAG: DMT family transporter [Stellaceae bacterium]